MVRSSTVDSLVSDVLEGRMNRRQAVKAAATTGLSVAAVLSGVAAASAGAQATPSAFVPQGPQVENLLFWTRSSPDTSPNEWDALTAVVEAYTAAVGSPVELVTVPDADFKQKMSLAAPSGDGPDVFGPVAHDWLGEFAVQKIAQSWTPESIAASSELSQPSIAAVSVDGQLYGVPLFSEALALMYNTDLVSEAPATWDDLVAKATELTSGEQYGFVFPFLEQYYQGPFFFGFGSYVFQYADGAFNTADIGLNNEGGVNAAKFLRDMYYNQQPAMPEALLDQASAGGYIDGLFESGQAAMTIAGPWREPPVTAAGIPYAVATLPTLPNGNPLIPFVGFQAMCANAYSENLAAAQDLVNFLGSAEGVSMMVAGFNKAPVRSTVTQAAVELNPNFEQWVAQAEAGVPMPNIPAMSKVWAPWGAAMTGVLVNNVPDEEVQALLDDAVATIDAEIKNSQA